MKSDMFEDDGLRRKLVILLLILISVGLVVVTAAVRSVIQKREAKKAEALQTEAAAAGDPTNQNASQNAIAGDLTGQGASQNAAAGEPAGLTISHEPEPEQSQHAKYEFSGGNLEVSNDPEINELFEGYFRAKLSLDAGQAQSFLMVQESGNPEEEQERLRWSGEYIEGYQDITCYTLPGPEPDSYLAYVYYKIKFYQSQVAAPSLSFAYVVRDGSGRYKIQNGELEENVKNYIGEAEQSEDVVFLTRQVQDEFSQALAEDEGLAAIYSIAMGGPAGQESTDIPAVPGS